MRSMCENSGKQDMQKAENVDMMSFKCYNFQNQRTACFIPSKFFHRYVPFAHLL